MKDSGTMPLVESLLANWTEVAGFLTGVICVWLAARESVWTWPVGIANNVLYLIVFWRSGLYAVAGLQLIFATIAIYGIWNWLRGAGSEGRLRITRVGKPQALIFSALAALGFALIFLLLRGTDHPAPAVDALVTAMSITAQFMMSRKIIEHWLLWITADVIYVGMCFFTGLYLTAVLYLIFIGICIHGWFGWQRTEAREAAVTA